MELILLLQFISAFAMVALRMKIFAYLTIALSVLGLGLGIRDTVLDIIDYFRD